MEYYYIGGVLENSGRINTGTGVNDNTIGLVTMRGGTKVQCYYGGVGQWNCYECQWIWQQKFIE